MPAVHRGAEWPGVQLLDPVLAEVHPRHLELDGWPGDICGPGGDGKFAVVQRGGGVAAGDADN